jgi:hypothetical protein
MKSPVSILAIVPFLVCVVTPAARGATSARLVSEWRFENNADDTSGSANNGISSGAPVYVPGRFGQAVYLSRADSIQKTGAANLPVLAADSWSCNQWIYLTNAPDSLAFFTGFGNASSSAGAGTARALIAFGNPNARGIYSWGSSRDVASGVAFPTNEWVMITITHNGANGTRTIWVNGTNVISGVQALGTAPATISAGVVAFSPNKFEGLIDEFTIWRGLLSPTDIQGLTNGTLMIAADPQSLTNSVGQSARLVGAAVGSPPVSYQWLKNGEIIDGATANVLNFANLAAADAGFYSLVANNTSGSVTSAPAAVLLPVITIAPQSLTRYAGEPARLAGAAAGATPTYFWLKDDVVLPNASGNVLSFSNLSTDQAGSYALVASNSFGSATSQVAVVTVIPVTAVSDALAGYWNFDEGTGNLLVDYSGNGNDGTLVNYPSDTSWVGGQIGGALSFGGAASSNYVVVPNYPKPFSTLTVSAWVWADARPSFATIVKNWADAAGQQQFHFGIEAAVGDLSNYIKQQGGTQVGPVREGASSPLPLSSWQHVAVVCDGQFMRLYRNGAPVGSPVAYNGTLNTNPIPTSLGIGAKIRSATLVDSYWQGKMDDLGLWTRGLTEDEILAIYAAGLNAQPLTDAAVAEVAPIISTQPANQTVPEGSTATFSVSAAGTAPLSFQWRKNGQDIPGATSSVLQLTNSSLCASDAGEFTVLVCNQIECVVSDPPALLTVTPVPVAPITNGLFAHWTFDETSGTTAANSFGAADNGLLNNYLPGDNSQWVTGRIGGALNFSGQASSHYVSIATYPKPTNAMSASAWVWADARPTWATIVKNWGGGTGGQFHFGLQDTGGDLSNFLQTQTGATPNTREGAATPLPTNSWQHVAFTADGATLRLYRNGAQVSSVAYTGNLINSVMAPLGIGVKLNDAGTAPDTGSPGFWQGKMDDLGLWSRALNGNEVRAIYNAGLQGLNLEAASVLPNLQIVRTGATATLSWPALPVGNCFTLESSDELPGTSWTSVGPATLNGGRYSVTVSTITGDKFYQLRK